jgi:glycyl-tRNA synthetase
VFDRPAFKQRGVQPLVVRDQSVEHDGPRSFSSAKSAGSALAAKLRRAGVPSRVDASGASIGKRYARNDELGTPYGLTIDFACKCSLSRRIGTHRLLSDLQTAVSKRTLTVRERDTTDQLIGSVEDVVSVVADLCNDRLSWKEACEKLERYSGVQDTE